LLNPPGRDLVSDGPGVAGHGGRGGVDLVDEQGQGAGDAGAARLVEGDGDLAGGVSYDVGQAPDDGLPGDGAVLVVVLQVGVQVSGEPVLGVVREQAAASSLIICPARISREAGAGLMPLCTSRASTGSATWRDRNGSRTITAQMTQLLPRPCGVPEVCLTCELQRCTGVSGRP
jgi:hypothetical protein